MAAFGKVSNWFNIDNRWEDNIKMDLRGTGSQGMD
jgi:hypothetical protein